MPCKVRKAAKSPCRSKPDHDRSFCKRFTSFPGNDKDDPPRSWQTALLYARSLSFHSVSPSHRPYTHTKSPAFSARRSIFFTIRMASISAGAIRKQFRAFFSDIIVPMLQWHLDLRKSYHLFLHSFPARSAAAHPATAPLDHAHCKL